MRNVSQSIWKRWAFRAIAITALAAGSAKAATTYTPTTGTTDLWSAGSNWTAVPTSGSTTQLTFVATNATVQPDALANTNTNDIAGLFQLNILDLNGTGPSAGAGSITLGSAAPSTGLSFVSNGATTPVVNLNALAGASGLTYVLSQPVTLSNNTSFTGSGTATFVVSGAIGGTGNLTKVGASTLTLAAPNTYAGSTTITGGTLLLNGGANTLPVGTTVGFTGSATLNVGSTNQSIVNLTVGNGLTGTVTGSTGSLALTNTSFQIGSTTAVGNQTLNMSGIGAFTFNSSGTFNVGTTFNNASASNSTLTLASSNTITTSALNIAFITATLTSTANGGTVNLGKTNTLNADSIVLGTQSRGNGTMQFQAIANPSLTIRGTVGGTSRAAMVVGSQSSAAVANTGTVNLVTNVTGTSTLDGLFSTLTIGKNARGSSAAANPTVVTGTFTLGGGTLDATNILVGQIVAGTDTTSTALSTATGTLTFGTGGGTVKVGTLTMGDMLTASTNTKINIVATVNLNNGGTLNAQTITPGANATAPTVRNFNWNDGTIGNLDASTDLTINSGLTLTLASTGTHRLNVGAGRTATIGSVLAGSGGTLTIDGGGTAILSGVNTYTGATTVSGGILKVTGSTDVSSTVSANGTSASLFGTVGGAGNIGGPIAVNAFGHLAPSFATGTSATTMQTTNNVSFTGGSVIDVVFTAGGAAYDQISGNAANVLTLPTSGAITVNIYNSAGGLANGTYTLFNNFGAVTGDAASSFGVNVTPLTGKRYTFSSTGTEIVMTISDTATATWTGGSAVDSKWSRTQNWAGGVTPVLDDKLVFAGTARLTPLNDLADTINYVGITFSSNAGAFTLTGNGVPLIGDVLNNSANDQVINMPLALNGLRTVDTSTRNMTIAGALGGSGALAKYGTGTLTLSGNNTTFPGDISIMEGTLKAGGATAIPATNMNVGGTATLDVNGNSVTFGTLSGAGTITSSSAGTPLLTLGNAGTGSFTYSGSIQNGAAASVRLSTQSPATITLAGTNTYTGSTSINAGVLNAGSSQALNTPVAGGTISFGGGTLQYSAPFAAGSNGDISGRIKNSTSPISIDTNGQNAVFASVIDASNTAALTKIGAGALTLSAANTFTGGTILNAGQLNINANTALGAGAFIINGGTFDNASGAPVTLINNNPQVWNADIQFGGSNNLNMGTAPIALSTSTTVSVAGSTLTLGGGISGGFSIAKSGAGTLLLTAPNTYSGSTTISGGTLALSGADNVLPAGTNVSFNIGGTLNIGAANQAISSLFIESSSGTATVVGTGTLTANGQFSFGSFTANSTQTMDMKGLANFLYNAPLNDVTVSGLNNSTGATTTATLFLAANNTINARSFNAGHFLGNSLGSGNNDVGTIHLGQTNVIYADTLGIGDISHNLGTLKFQAALTNPSLTIRATDGIQRATMNVGQNMGDSNSPGGVVDLATGVTGGSALDAMISTLTIGNTNRGSTAGTALGAFGSFTMGGGTLDAMNIIVGTDTPGTATSSGACVAQGTFTLGVAGGAAGGTVKVTTLTIGAKNSSGNDAITSTINLNNGGTIRAQAIQAGSGAATRTFNWNDGIVKNYDATTDLIIGAGPTWKLAAAGTHAINIDAGRRGIVSAALSDATSQGTLAINGNGVVTLNAANTYTGTTTLSSGTLNVLSSNETSQVVVSSNAVLRGTGTLQSAAVGFAGAGIVFPGDATLSALTDGPKGALTAKSANFGTNGGKLRVRVFSTGPGGGVEGDRLIVNTAGALSLGGTSSLELRIQAPGGTYSTPQDVLIASATDGVSDLLNTSFSSVSSPSGTLPNITVLYVNHLFTPGDTANIVATQTIPSSSAPNVSAGYDRIFVRLSGAVTPATVDSFTARAVSMGVALEWNCVSEFQNAGFNIYRRAAQETCWTRANPALITGRITSPEAKTYRFFDWASAGEHEYKLESVSIFGQIETYPSLAGPIVIDPMALSVPATDDINAAVESVEILARSARTARIEQHFAALSHSDTSALYSGSSMPASNSGDGSINAATVNSIPSTREADSLTAAPVLETITAKSATAGVRWFTAAASTANASRVAAKVVYGSQGVLLVPKASLPPGFDVHHVAIEREGRSVTALGITPDGLVLAAPGYEDDYTNKDVFFLRKSAAPTAAGSPGIAQGLFESAQQVCSTSPATVRVDYHDVYFDYGSAYAPFNFAPWFSSQYLTDGTVQTFAINTPFVSSGAAMLTLNLWSLTHDDSVDTDHALQIVINNQPAGQVQWDGGGKMMQLSLPIPAGLLVNGANRIELATPILAGVTSQIAFLHSMTLSCTRDLDGSKPIDVYNPGSKEMLFEIANLPSASAWVVDTRYVDRPALVPYAAQAQPDGTFKIRFKAAAGGAGRFQVVPRGLENRPLEVSKRQIKPLKPAPYLAVGPSQFSAALQPLLARRSKEGIRAQFADQEQLFDYYNYGRYGPAGIQKAVRSTRPQYLLLAGRTTYDYKNYSGQNVDPLCPAFLVATSFWAQTTSDSLFGDLGRGYPEVAVGRLPVVSSSDLSTAVSHILNYSGLPASGMRLHAVADKPDPTTADFGAQLDALVKSNHPDVAWQENYLQRTWLSAAEVTSAMREAASGGADLILYSGHGNASRLGKEDPRILDQESVQAWTGNTVFIQATCTANWTAANSADYKSIAMQALTQPQGGIAASIGTSTYMSPDAALSFVNQLLMNTRVPSARWGTALVKAQQWAARQSNGNAGWMKDLANTELQFGDPAMPVYSPAAKSSVGSKSSSSAGASVGNF